MPPARNCRHKNSNWTHFWPWGPTRPNSTQICRFNPKKRVAFGYTRLEVIPVKFCNFLDLPPARNCRQPTQRQQNCSWARFWHGQMMRDPIQLSAPLRSVELFSGIQGGHINFQLESISPAWIFTDDFLSYKKHVGGIFKASFLLFKNLFIWLQNPKSNSQFIYFHLLHSTYIYLQFSFRSK